MDFPLSVNQVSNNTRFHADLDFHVKVLKSCFIHSIEGGDTKSAQNCYTRLASLHFKPQVAIELLSFGVQLIQLTEPAESIQFQTKELLKCLIALKGTYLNSYVRKLAEIYLNEDNNEEAIALIKSKLSGKASRSLLDEFNLS